MLTCPNPSCGKKLPALERACPRCRTDLSLLVDYVEHLDGGLAQADALTRAGELGEAVWAYLEVLEVDPDNAAARRQIGQVVAAVRQFDRAATGRRWLHRLQRQARFREWVHSWGGEGFGAGWLLTLFWISMVVGALLLGYSFGHYAARVTPDTPPPKEAPQQEDETEKK